MRKYCLLFTVFIATLNNASGEIKNGYEKEISQMRESLRSLTTSLQVKDHLLPYQRRKIGHLIDLLINEISNYELTENLLNRFKIISPDQYAEIDTLRDSKGRNVTVYVKFISIDETKIKSWGTTYMRQMEDDIDTYRSEYGKLTVSVKIWIVNKALVVLAHELGHVKYQVPNFAAYMKYYRENYGLSGYPGPNIGHKADDLSGDSATQYEKRFQKQYAYFLRTNNEKIQNPTALKDRIRRNLTW